MTDSEEGSKKSSNGPTTQKSAIVMTARKTMNEHSSRYPEDVYASSIYNASDNFTEKKQRRSKTWWKCIYKVFSPVLSIIAIVAVIVMLCVNSKVEYITPAQTQQNSTLQVPRKITGSFKLDQMEFASSNQTRIRWTPASSKTNNLITASPDAPCLVVPEQGRYIVLSELAFDINKDEDVGKLAHLIQLEGYQIGQPSFLRKFVFAPLPENRNNREVISSTMISFPGMEANGRICVYTPDVNKKNLYNSATDNTVNILQM